MQQQQSSSSAAEQQRSRAATRQDDKQQQLKNGWSIVGTGERGWGLVHLLGCGNIKSKLAYASKQF